MKLNRIYPGEDGKLHFREGEYGQENGIWYLRLPGCNVGSLETHQVTEHQDGTITVSPSILHHDLGKTVHGFLERGMWREA